jgi:hypothetical protein
VKTETQKQARWSKYDAYRTGRKEIDTPREMAQLRKDIDAGWRYFIAQKTKRQVLEQ